MSPASAHHQPLALFSLDAGRAFASRVAAALGTVLSAHEEREFEDGEHKTRPLESVRGRDVYVIQALHGDAAQSVNDRLIRLLFFLGTLRDADPARLTAVVPYLCYSRKDRQTKARDPVSTRYLAALFEAVGVGRVVTLDVHNLAAYQNAFRLPTVHLEARPLFVEYFARRLPSDEPVTVVSPDVGGIKRAERFREALEQRLERPVEGAFMEKHRSAGVLSGERLVGETAEREVILLDDLISGGNTLARAARACAEQGAARVWAAASHGVFSADASQTLAASAITRLVVTDSLPLPPSLAFALKKMLSRLDTADFFARAIRHLHTTPP
ncbi:ribose-phosphate diphosphokinase [Alkalilimnicola sp. S0819]|uniref:ribose-phosphate diphosphokinase n=1 Tax=Alkalilimnicola sp. S0819 TaxID=2613922 RepID=UPI0012620201|nr:ribose-phosphate pyrophosphokinase [Alkalilimnicola sp. S0819]KAB7624119.1 ribose-phosphate pyrophosphokinase [Alkalilimnicola sp. S0819]MPQ16371.1 ribose-phosphate diphosphokinase [Alkalilimnicola sp. S0819]